MSTKKYNSAALYEAGFGNLSENYVTLTAEEQQAAVAAWAADPEDDNDSRTLDERTADGVAALALCEA